MSTKRSGALSRREFLYASGLAAGVGAMPLGCGPGPARERPNILWITCEDICPDLGCYGDPVAATPQLDAFAAQGVRYTHAFSVSGVCAPSRSCLITGMYPTTIGSHHMRTGGDPQYLPKGVFPYETVPPPDVKCFTEYLRAAGYYCTNRVKTDYQFGLPITAWDECSPRAHYRNRPAGQPFFCVLNDTVTHESQIWTPPDKAVVTDPARVPVPPYYPDTPVVRHDLARYYDNIATMDGHVGEILGELDADGLADSTIVFFYGDNGRCLPRGKRWVYDSGIHVPLLIRWPGQVPPGSVCDDLVSFLDFAPTVLSLAGVVIPSHMQGQAFLGDEAAGPRDYVFAARDRMDETYDQIRAVRDQRYKYIRNYSPEKPYAQPIAYMDRTPALQEMRRLHAEGRLVGPQTLFFRETKPGEELYDLTLDPHEINSLAESPAHQEILQRMRTVHERWRVETNDLGAVPEDQMIRQMWPGGMQPETAPPVIDPAGGRFGGPQTVRLTCPTAGASIAYTLESTGQPRWLLYARPVELTASGTLRCRAIRYGYKESAEMTADFEIG